MSTDSHGGQTAPIGFRRKRRRPARRAGLALLAVGLALPLGATSASADITPVAAPHLIEVLPGLDIVSVEGYGADQELVIEVWRDGVKIGSTGTPKKPANVIPDADDIALPMGTIFEVNHEGNLCWAGHTPDIIPGDEIRVITEEGNPPVGEATQVANVLVDAPAKKDLDGDGEFNDVVMTGRALNPDGSPMTAADFAAGGSAEIVQPAFRDVGVPDAADEDGWDRRVLGADSTGVPIADGETFGLDDVGTLEYDDATGDWIATWKNLPVPTADRPSFADLALDGEHNFMFTTGAGTEETGGQATTVAQPGDASGGAQGCPAPISVGVTGTTPSNVNLATSEMENLTVSGKSYTANMVHVTVDDSDGDAADAVTLSVAPNKQVLLEETPAPIEQVKQTWTAAVPMSDVLELDDGDLVVSALYDYVVETEQQRQVGATNADGTPVLEPAFAEDGVTPLPADDPSLYLDPATNQPVQAEDAAGPMFAADGSTPVYTRQVIEAETFYAHTVEQRTGTTHSLLKDRVAPEAPTASPDPATNEFRGTQYVTLNAADDIEDTVRYRIGGSDIADPTRGSRAVDGQIVVSSTQTIKARSYDRAGNPSPVMAETFTILPTLAPDTAAPLAVTRVPAPVATDVGALRNLRVTFNEQVVGVNGANFQLVNAETNRRVRATVRFNPVTQTARLNPRRRLAPGTEFVATLRGIRDAAGNRIRATRWSFTTDPAPTVARWSPRPNATGVGRGRNIRFWMSERVAGVRHRTVQLRQAGNNRRVAAQVSYNGHRRIVINPRRALRPHTRYTVTLTRGVRDRQGNRMDRDRWDFTTRRRR